MRIQKCPGQDTRYWKPEDISERNCPYCGKPIEFFKTDIRAKCPGCGRKVANPSFNLGCAEWCAYAKECLGTDMSEVVPRKFRAIVMDDLDRLFENLPDELAVIKERMNQGELWCREREINPLPLLTAFVLIRAAEHGLIDDAGKHLQHYVNDMGLPPPIADNAYTLVKKIEDMKAEGKPVTLPEDLLN